MPQLRLDFHQPRKSSLFTFISKNKNYIGDALYTLRNLISFLHFLLTLRK